MRFEFTPPRRIVFGEGVVREVPAIAAEYGRRALVVTGRSPDRAAGLVRLLHAEGIETVPFAVAGEPTLEIAREGVAAARDGRIEMVIAVGGGSALDAGKAIAVLAANAGDVLEYLEVIGLGKPFERRAVPVIAVPTTAGTGSEVTRNAVLASPDHGVKASLRSASMLPVAAVVDPELTYDMPPAVTASTGLDALTQLIEPYVSVRANAMTDLFCLEGMRRAAGALAQAFRTGQDRDARRDMAYASLLGGLALANAGLGAVHGFAAPIGGMFSAAHGAVCAALLPHVMAANIRALRARDPEHAALARYRTAARILTGFPDADAEDGAAWASEIANTLKIPPLRSYGIRERDVPALTSAAARASSMKGNPISLTPKELVGILNRAL
ncbi:MAG TPA: iron-containing alcohol dehydrogenase [Bryobacteraceae bacterium]|nr:iron-containing alcohol dehydrogenase [Bryobacteraceae bacterium]